MSSKGPHGNAASWVRWVDDGKGTWYLLLLVPLSVVTGYLAGRVNIPILLAHQNSATATVCSPKPGGPCVSSQWEQESTVVLTGSAYHWKLLCRCYSVMLDHIENTMRVPTVPLRTHLNRSIQNLVQQEEWAWAIGPQSYCTVILQFLLCDFVTLHFWTSLCPGFLTNKTRVIAIYAVPLQNCQFSSPELYAGIKPFFLSSFCVPCFRYPERETG